MDFDPGPAIAEVDASGRVFVARYGEGGALATSAVRNRRVLLRPAMSSVYPNPFSERAFFEIVVPTSSVVVIAAYDVLGREVTVVHHGHLTAGDVHHFEFDGADLLNGLYLLQARGGGFMTERVLHVQR